MNHTAGARGPDPRRLQTHRPQEAGEALPAAGGDGWHVVDEGYLAREQLRRARNMRMRVRPAPEPSQTTRRVVSCQTVFGSGRDRTVVLPSRLRTADVSRYPLFVAIPKDDAVPKLSLVGMFAGSFPDLETSRDSA